MLARALAILGLALLLLPFGMIRSLPDVAGIRTEVGRQETREQYCDRLLKDIPEADKARPTAKESEARVSAPPADKNLRYLDLTRAKLDGKDLSGFDLRFTILNRASFKEADFSGADLRCASLLLAQGPGASLRGAKLDGARLSGANLMDAALFEATLERANVSNAILRSADLSRAKLSGARLDSTDLEKAILSNVDLRWADYRPLGAPRPAQRMLNLLEVHPTTGDFLGLSALRKALVEAGDPSQARRVTYVIESWRDRYRLDAADKSGWWEATALRALVLVRSVAFDLTVDYGVSPARALSLLAASIPAFALLYMLLIQFGPADRKFGLFQVTPKGVLKIDGPRIEETPAAALRRIDALSWDKVIEPAFWFSLLSAFRFGYGTFTLSSWLTVLQPREAEYRAVGVIRIVGGLQSLISLYLLVLFVATLFGDIFAGWS